MIMSNNIRKIDFNERCEGGWVPHSVIFNVTQISEKEVEELIRSGRWDREPKIIQLRPTQFKYLQDKEG